MSLRSLFDSVASADGSTALVVTLTVGLGIIVVARMSTRGKSRGGGRPPGPRRLPILGNLTQLAGNGTFFEKLNEMRKTHGDVLYLELGAVKTLVVFGHDMVKRLLVDYADSFQYRPVWLVEIKSLQLSNGIVWSNGADNQRLRRFALPCVFPGVGKQTLEQRIQIEAEALMSQLHERSGDSATLKDLFFRAIGNINCSVIFGKRYEYEDAEFGEFLALMDSLLQRQGVKNPLNFFPILQRLPEGKKPKATREVLSKVSAFLHRKLVEARTDFDKDNIRGLLDMYLAQESDDNPIKEENVYHIVRDFFVAGTENVAIALVWLVGYTARDENVQDTCRKCVKEFLGERSCPGMEDIKHMPYLEATVNEALRLASITPLSVPHATQEEVEFEGYTIPRDTMVLTHMQSVNLDPAYWEEPDNFRPERFIKDDAVVSKEAFYPYSIGPRYCLAAKLSQMELTIMFATLIKHFRFTTAAGAEAPSLRHTQPGAFVEPETFKVTWSSV
ncbi:cytochrome P450 2J6-like [Mya arenaria]|uniref:cytochrome P450 2J6-like n=1 Tax=Mya arenaria TaxID=6604 RepID=UPI0022E03B04|nr:cytochrome P450 2J6-like [Mya arenaria]XP_052767759.1 cytochrome P450 2J6-like [Mya arenaria]XP_052769417.1 cytochrome P450 2J6-like [Mya arenaria]